MVVRPVRSQRAPLPEGSCIAVMSAVAILRRLIIFNNGASIVIFHWAPQII